MTEAKPRGRFVWFDLITSNPDAAPAFYSPVTGWETMKWDGPAEYTMWTTNGAPLGGVMKLPAANVPPHWLAYISTPDVDATVKQAVNLGARVATPPTDIPTVGRFAVMADPQGAVFAAFAPESTARGHDGAPAQGEFSWHELATHDYPAAFRFYERLFGWEKRSEMDMGGGNMYLLYGRKDREMGGMFNKTAEMPGPPAWTHYVMVDSVDRAVDAVKARGGQVLVGPMEVPGGDWIAQCMDPQGAVFAVHAKKR
jgi:predicted enzyme related to lactoylglutathione lyase